MNKEQQGDKDSVASPLPAGSLNRAVVLLNTIAGDSHKGSTMTRLVARSGLPRPTIHRVLNMLMTIGWVERDQQTGRYNLGADLAALGYSAMSRHPIERIAATDLSMLAKELQQVVFLGVRSGLDMVCIGRYDSASEIQVGRGGVGMRSPFGITPACMGMLACMPETEVNDIIRANLSRYYRMEGFDEKGFHQTVAESRKAGVGIYGNILLDRTTSGLGVAICNPAGSPIAGIGTVYISEWLDDQQRTECLARMQEAALRISAQLMNPRNGVLIS